MKTTVRIKPLILLLVLLALTAVSLVLIRFLRPKEPDPHEGQVYINDGFGMVWMTPLEGVAVNPLEQTDFRVTGGEPVYTGDAFEVRRGIDVSEHQYEIDWAQVAASDIDYAYIRLGYRGYTEGGLFEDPYFQANIQSALNYGIDVGVYMFSQAVNVQEAIQEAEFVLERLKDYNVTLPVMYDWEKIEGGGARTDDLSPAILSECAVAFCETVKNAGYEPGVYFNRYLGYYGYDLSRLTDYKFWVAVPGEFPDFYYASDFWQYSFSGSVAGVSTPADLNLMFIPKASPEEGEEAEK